MIGIREEKHRSREKRTEGFKDTCNHRVFRQAHILFIYIHTMKRVHVSLIYNKGDEA
jgi:hypothetical protein